MRKIVLLATFLGLCTIAFSQTTSWKGTFSTAWATAANWTNGVPGSTKEAIIGDANFTGNNQPRITSTAACKSLTLGGGTKASTLTLSSNLSVSGAVTVASNGTITQGNCTISLTGNLTYSGTYTPTYTSSNFTFAGTSQTIGGTSTSAFQRMTINQGSVVTLNRHLTVNGTLGVSGTLNPAESPSYKITFGTNAAINVLSSGTLKVTGTLLTDNYSGKVPAIYVGSTIEYSAATAAQTISNSIPYSTLRISGSGVRTLAGNITMGTNTTAIGNIYLMGGTLDLLTHSATRASSGGTLSLANGTTLKVGGANNFPANYATTSLNLTSTVQYYAGGTQTVSARTYGNLFFTSTASGTVVKTMPSSAIAVAGNFTSTQGSATTLTYTAASNITVSGVMTIGSGTTFNGSVSGGNTTYTHKLGGNFVNNGAFNGNNSIVDLNGSGAVVSGTGTHNFNNLTVTASNITASATTLTVSGNLSTSGSGMFKHNAGGILTMSGTSKTVTGTNIIFSNLTVTGTATTVGVTIADNLAVSGSLTCSNGTIVMSGTGRTLSGSGTIALNTLSATGTITASTGFSISGTLDITGSFTATGGTATFKSSSLINGTTNLFNVAIDGTSLQLAANTVLGIAGAFTITSGTFNVSATVPNTVIYNGGGQTVRNTTYHHLILANGSNKTAGGAVAVNGDFTLNQNTTFLAAPSTSYTHTVKGNWINGGTFTAGNSIVAFTGGEDVSITGATTFKELTINKTATSNTVTLQHNIASPVVNMIKGSLRTGSNKVTITNTRTGSGVITGTIERLHSFTNGVSYAFESADNTITFTSPSNITAVTVTVTDASVASFPFGSATNRNYAIAIPSGTYTSAALRLHYEDESLNGNNESSMTLWKYSGATWTDQSKNSNSTTANYVEKTGLTAIGGNWTLANTDNVVTWNGSVSSDWFDAANWTTIQGIPSKPPSANDIVQIGTSLFTHNPSISGAATAKGIVFGSAQSATLNITSGSLTTAGNISGAWSANREHTIAVNGQTLLVNGSLVLSDGTADHKINLAVGTGTVTVKGTLTQAGGASVSFNGAGTLNIGGDFIHSSGVFDGGTGTVVYNGTGSQAVAGVTYHQLTINKTAGIATAGTGNTTTTNLSILAGQFDFFNPTTITGNVTIASGAVAKNITTVLVGGNWANAGTYIPEGGSVTFNGTGAQAISANTFNNLIINKPSGTATLTGNIVINYTVTVASGTLDLATYSLNRSSVGGTFTVANDASLLLGANNFPANYVNYTFGPGSTTAYYGATAQSVLGLTYGNLSFAGGAKALAASVVVQGNLEIGSGATLSASSYTIDLNGNWTNGGTFTPGTGAVLLNGATKTITGNTTFNKLTVYGTYTVGGSALTFNESLRVLTNASFNAGSGAMTLYGDLLNSGVLISTGTTTFKGTSIQNISLINAISSTSTGIINFEGSVAPVLNSTSEPNFATVNITNTAGIAPSVSWNVYAAMNIGAGATFIGGGYTHNLYGSFTNGGTVTSDGVMNFSPAFETTVALGNNTFSSSGLVIFGDSSATIVTGTPDSLENVIINNFGGVSPTGNWIVKNTMTIEEDGVFNAGSGTYTIVGNLESSGTLNGGTSTFDMTSVVAQLSGSVNTTFYDLKVSGSTGVVPDGENAALTINADFNVAHNLTSNYVIDASAAGVTFTGNTTSTITGSASSFALQQFSVAKTGGSSAVLAKSLTDVNSINLVSGTLEMGTHTITQDATADAVNTLTILDGATLKIGGSNSLPAFTAYELDTLSTVEYAGGAATTQSVVHTVGSAPVKYGNLVLSTGGTKTASGALTVAKHFTLSNGTFNAAGYAHSVGGDWTMTSGTFTNADTIIFSGSMPQVISSTGAFNHLTANNATGLNLASGITVNGVLRFGDGKITANAYDLTIGNSGSISGATDSKYIVTNGAGVLKQQVTTSSSKSFPVGTPTNYLPATIGFNGNSTTDIISVGVDSVAYMQGNSGTLKTTRAVAATWNISEAVVGGSDATVSLQWPASLEQSGFVRTASRLAHYDGVTWDSGTDLIATGTNPFTVSRSGTQGYSPFSVRMSETLLPVTWLTVSGKREGENNRISWSTASETNNRHFEVQASTNGASFTTIGQVQGAVNAASAQHYSYTHHNASAPVTYYRIRQVDMDGRFSYSVIVKVNAVANSIQKLATLSPNPVKGAAVISVSFATATTVQIALSDAAGHILETRTKSMQAGINVLPLDMDAYAAGVYYLQLTDADGAKQSLRFIKQ